MNRLIYFLLIIASAILFSGCEQQVAIQPSGKTVKVGFVGPFTGPFNAMGREAIKGVRTVMHMQPMLRNGDAIELVIENDNNDPELMKRALQKLVEEDKVSAILLASGSKAALKAASVADSARTPVIALLATHPGVVEKRKYVSQLCFDDRFQGSVAALYVADELLIEKVAVFTELDDLYSIFLGAQFVRKYEAVDGVITDTIVLNKDKNNYDEIFKSIRDKGTELLYFPVGSKYAIEIVKAAKRASWKPDMMGSDGLLASVLNNHPEDVRQLEGIYATDFFGTFDDLSRTEFANRARKTYLSLFNGIPSSYTSLGAEGYGVLYAAMDQCKDTADRECINRKIRSTHDFQGLMGKISILSDGKAVRPLHINRIADGELKSVVKVY